MSTKNKKRDRKLNRRDFLKTAGAITVGGLAGVSVPRFTWPQAKVIKVGVLEPLSGPMGMLGKLDKWGFDYVFDKMNAAGGIKSMGGAKIEALYGESEGKPEVGISQTEILIRKGACAILGAYQSSVVFAATA